MVTCYHQAGPEPPELIKTNHPPLFGGKTQAEDCKTIKTASTTFQVNSFSLKFWEDFERLKDGTYSVLLDKVVSDIVTDKKTPIIG